MNNEEARTIEIDGIGKFVNYTFVVEIRQVFFIEGDPQERLDKIFEIIRRIP